MTDRELMQMALDALRMVNSGTAYPTQREAIKALRDRLTQPEREWEELDVNEVIELIHEHITNPSPELTQELYGLVANICMYLQEKNT